MISWRLLLASVTVLLATGVLLAGAPVHAAGEKQEITISPASLKVSTTPGVASSGTFKVVNTGDLDFDYKVYAKPYSVTGEGYGPNYSEENGRSLAYQWVSFDITSGTLKPRQEQEIAYEFFIPANAAPGSHHSVIFAETVPKEGSGDMVVRTKRVGTLVRMTVGGERVEEARTESIHLPWLQWQSSLQASVRLENVGNVDADVATGITVRSLFGTVLHAEQRVNAVFPDHPRVIEYEWPSKWRAGIYRAEVTSEVFGRVTTVNRFVILAPAWAVAVVVVLLLSGALFLGYRHLRKAA